MRTYLRIANSLRIQDHLNPIDGKFKFGSNTLFKYYERKVEGLNSQDKNSVKQQIELAIQNQLLVLKFDDEIFYPDPKLIDRGNGGYFISFTIKMDSYQANIVQYSECTTHDYSKEDTPRYEAHVKGLMVPDVVPYCCGQSYLNKLINLNLKLRRFMALETDDHNNKTLVPIVIQGTFYHGTELYVYGQRDHKESLDSCKKLFKMSLIHLKSSYSKDFDKIPYIEDYVDPQDGTLIFSNNTVFCYIERRVWDLIDGSWAEGTEYAISNGHLFLNINGRKIFPDRHEIDNGLSGYWVSYTFNYDVEQAKKINFSPVQNSDFGQYKYYAIATGLCMPVPIAKQFIVNYLKKLINLNIHGIGNIQLNNGTHINIEDVELINGQVCVFGNKSDIVPKHIEAKQDTRPPELPKYENLGK